MVYARKCYITLLYHAIRKKCGAQQNKICNIQSVHSRRAECNAVEFTIAFLYSD